MSQGGDAALFVKIKAAYEQLLASSELGEGLRQPTMDEEVQRMAEELEELDRRRAMAENQRAALWDRRSKAATDRYERRQKERERDMRDPGGYLQAVRREENLKGKPLGVMLDWLRVDAKLRAGHVYEVFFWDKESEAYLGEYDGM